MTSTWASGVSGDFNDASKWIGGVPGTGDTALITAPGTYTVTSDMMANSFGTLEMAKGATLNILQHHIEVTAGTGTGALDGTIDVGDATALQIGTAATNTKFTNNGTINLQPVAGTAKLVIVGNVTLAGTGKINLSGTQAQIVSLEPASGTLTNSNTIMGTGIIGDSTAPGTLNFVNATTGIVDANNPQGMVIQPLGSGAGVTNAGLLAASGAILEIDSDVDQTSTGRIKADTAGATVALNGITVGNTMAVGGGKVVTVKGSVLSAIGVNQTIIGNVQSVVNAGEITTDSCSFEIDPAIQNAGGKLLAAGNGVIVANGKVIGGKAEISGSGVIDFRGASSAAVTFDTGSTGLLTLFDVSQFTGTVAGMSSAPGAAIDLQNIKFADHPVISFSATTHLLVVKDLSTGVTDKIRIVGTGTFTDKPATDGSTLITDPPASMAGPSDQSVQLFAQSMASFGAPIGLAVSGSGSVADSRGSSDFLAASHHG